MAQQNNTPSSEFDKTLKAAEHGVASAQCKLGNMYFSGSDGVEQDYQLALEWFTKAANQGDVEAQDMIGCMFYDGQGVEQDYQKAFSWFSKSAERGSCKGQSILGVMYKEGLGIKQNYRKALKLLHKTSDKQAVSVLTLAQMYLDGIGVKQDSQEAVYFFSNALLLGDDRLKGYIQRRYPDIYAEVKNSINGLASFISKALEGTDTQPEMVENILTLADVLSKKASSILEFKDNILNEENSQQPTPTQLTQVNQDNAIDSSKEQVAEADKDTPSSDKIAQNIEPPPDGKSIENLKEAQAGDATAQFNLGTMYYKGAGVDQDYEQAAHWYQKAAEQDHPVALFNVGSMYKEGKGVTQDSFKARDCFEKAAELNNLAAIRVLGDMYLEGQGIPKDTAKAKRLFKKAATLEKNARN